MFHEELFVGGVYLSGILSFFSPCIFPLIPVYLGMLSFGGKKSYLRTFLFVLGLSTSFVLLGFGFGTITSLLMSSYFRIFSALLVIFFGILQLDFLKIPFLEKTKLLDLKKAQENSLWGAFFLGFSFSLGWTPCVGPILGSILFLASAAGEPLYAASMLLVYVLGLTTPFVIFTLLSNSIRKRLSVIQNYLLPMKKLGGLIIILMGVLLLTDHLNLFLQ